MGLPQLSAVYDSISWDKKHPALVHLRSVIREHGDVAEICKAIDADPVGWFAPHHFLWGMQIRNSLRQAGFGENYWPVGNLDDIYVELVEDAVRMPESEKDANLSISVDNWQLDSIVCVECGEETDTCCGMCRAPLCGDYKCVFKHVERHLSERDSK